MEDVIVPKMGMSSDEVDVLEWHVGVGDAVSVGTPLVDVESEKAVLTIESELAGVVAEIVADQGATVEVGKVICRIQRAS